MTILAQLRSKHIAPYTKSNNTKCSDVNSRLHETVLDRKIVDPRALGSNTKSQSKPETRGLERNQSLRRSRFKLKNTSADLIKTLPSKIELSCVITAELTMTTMSKLSITAKRQRWQSVI